MKRALFLIISAFLFCGICAAQNHWKLSEHKGRASIIYDWDIDSEVDKTPEIKGLSALLADHDMRVPLKHISFWGYFNNDPIIQNELRKEFQTHYPKLLEDAVDSSGNMHNPKVLPLRAKLSECLLKTPTIAKINDALRVHNYAVDRMSFEKFWIEKGEGEPTFHTIIWLILEPKKAGEKS